MVVCQTALHVSFTCSVISFSVFILLTGGNSIYMGPSFEVPVLLTAVSGYKSSVGVSNVEHALEVVKSLRCLRDPERIHNVLLQLRLDLNKHLLDLLRDRKVLPTVPSDELENTHGTNFMHNGLIQLARSSNAGLEPGVAAGAPCVLCKHCPRIVLIALQAVIHRTVRARSIVAHQANLLVKHVASAYAQAVLARIDRVVAPHLRAGIRHTHVCVALKHRFLAIVDIHESAPTRRSRHVEVVHVYGKVLSIRAGSTVAVMGDKGAVGFRCLF